MQLKRIHHAAYRCRDARETVEWYQKHLGMEYILAFAEDYVPSTHAFDPYMHVFLDAGGGNVLAFFELPQQPEMGRDPNTPAWVQHIAFEVGSREELTEAKARLEGEGIEVIGPTDHTVFHSIYFFDPNGHRLELAWNDPAALKAEQDLKVIRWEMLEEWSRTRRAPEIGKWAHGSELDGASE
ncbi:Glyoxalase/bleomycin resistance protein/dioxygenase [Novosphingobium aromaticivorans DSM 12444]|uniref:Glyoxalase/bleomycin resistance protein/dioxygenase n=1 Tax=Novosphingobium aromaticivorans (strain ATCC 700278 / DSM 12444 / CCUG 56034 / CIP 105152 / NBRC 16084 / F199) TaxID=279238 RepID=Q2G5H3_NOVAD|nr:VOC family protein [Novosphingobium aromaticivorans]ABD26900.1 Glyoxalase/bleomycin resistance protein/dioxygenase [Novosphingobium aromaticivorans DSM 12444]SCY45004.1 Catechol 2,3-dioxygenase [Novosphingobium aromaticivorans]